MAKQLYNIFDFAQNHIGKVNGIADNSTLVKPGFAFVAIIGEKTDGHKYITSAIERGATTIIFQDEDKIDKFVSGVEYFKASDTKLAIAKLASTFYQNQPENVVAVTGTNGKSSVVDFYRQICELLNHPSASIGTLGVVLANQTITSPLTTPSAVTLFSLLSDLKDNNIEYVGLEASSHGLSQHRLDFVQLKAAAFTNITHDHLDYHGTLENYLSAKLQLFDLLQAPSFVIINADMPEYQVIKERCLKLGLQVLDYGFKGDFCRLLTLDSNVTRQNFSFEIEHKIYNGSTELIGEFQVYNILCAVLLVHACDLSLKDTIAAIPQLKSVPGRMEKITTTPQDMSIFVDYAHTPDALLKSLEVLKPLTANRLIVLFGCGGDRDKEKRPIMGEIAAKIAAIVIVTSDNPRSEDEPSIRREITLGCPEAISIGDRKAAIFYAVSIMKSGDILLIAGKGHEKTQTTLSTIIEFDDVKIAENAVKEYL